MRVLVALSFLILFGVCAAKAETSVSPQGGREIDILPEYLKEESIRIFREGDRIKGEAERLRMESKRLSSEGERLSENATHLDSLWLDAEQRWNLAKYPGYNRSQMHMRFDTVRLDNEANLLREEAQSLDEEAIRLWKLSGEVDPAAMKAILDRLRNCCNTKIGLQLLRVHIIRMAQTEHIRYVPR